MASPTALFPQPDGMFFAVLPFLIVFSGMVLSYREVSGSNLGYSKFAGDNSKQLRVPSKAGMFLLYFPSALVAGAPLLYWYGLLPALPEGLKSCGASGLASLLEKAGAASDERLWLLVVTVFAHFTKRDLEVWVLLCCWILCILLKTRWVDWKKLLNRLVQNIEALWQFCRH